MFFTTEFAVFNVVAAGFLMVSIQLWGSHAVVISTGNHRARSNVRKRVWQTYRAAHTVKTLFSGHLSSLRYGKLRSMQSRSLIHADTLPCLGGSWKCNQIMFALFPLIWTYAEQAQVFALNDCLVSAVVELESPP